MKYWSICISYIALGIFFTSCEKPQKTPLAPVKIVTDTYFGMEIKDPYRYMENLKDSLVLQWLRQQENYTNNVLENISGRQNIISYLNAFDNMQLSKISNLKITGNDRHFYLKREAGANVSKLYYRENFNDREVLLYDPKDFKPDVGIEYLINFIQPDWEGNRIVIGLTKKGEEFSEIIIFDVKEKKALPQVIDHCWPSGTGGVAWLPDNSGFIYLHHPEIDSKSEKFLLHTSSVLYKLGEDPKKLHKILSANASPEVKIIPEDFPIVSFKNQADKYLIAYIAGVDTFWDAYYTPLVSNPQAKLNWLPLFKSEDKVNSVRLVGDSLIYRSAKDAPNFQICMTSIINPDFDHPEILVKEKKDTVITNLEITSEGIFYGASKNGVEVSLYKYKNGKEILIDLPEVSGSLTLSSKGIKHPDLWVTTKGWISNGNRYAYDSATDSFTEANMEKSSLPTGVEDFIVEELTVKSHDGVEVPLSLIYKKGMEKNGKTSVMFHGYGAYGYSVKPTLTSRLYSWVMEGGIYAVPHVRGGGEKGEAWHKGGYITSKSNTWKDMIACVEYMIEKGYTSSSHTVVRGASAGGILAGRAMTDRPDLFAAAIVEVGSMNMIRSEVQPNGPNNVKEFGTVKDSIEFKALLEMDSYHHIKEGEHYPATLITAGMNDPRVVAWDPAKFAARLQAANASDKPILFDIDFESGHGMGDSKAKEFEKLANVLTFALWQTGHKDYQYTKAE